MVFYRDGFEAVGIDGMVAAFPEKGEAVVFQVADEVTPFDGHRQGPRAAARSKHCRGEFLCLACGRLKPFPVRHPAAWPGSPPNPCLQ